MNRLAILLPAALLFLGNCGTSPLTGGGGASETVAKVEVCERDIVVSVSGSEAFAIEASLCSDLYSAIDTGSFHQKRAMSGIADSWRISGLAEGAYTVILADNENGRATRFSCVISDTLKRKTDPEPDTLKASGTISGIVSEVRSDSSVVPVDKGTVCLNGTFFSAVTDRDGRYTLTGIPAGGYLIQAVKTARATNKSIDVRTVKVSGDSNSAADFTLTGTN